MIKNFASGDQYNNASNNIPFVVYYIIQILMFLGALQILFAKIYVLKMCRDCN